MKKKGFVAFVAAAFSVALVSSAFAAGTVSGKVTYSGTAPAPKPITITKDKEICGKTPKTTEDLVVGKDGGVEYAVVQIIGAKGAVKTGDLAFDQEGCHFKQHVLVVPIGSKVSVNNHDGLLHNFHMSAFENDEVNFGQPGDMKTKTLDAKSFTVPEIAPVKCDVHEWMKAWFVIADNPFVAVSDAGGAYKIENVPPGKYTVKLWHETLGEKSQEITVKDGDNKLDFSIGK